MRDEYRMKKRYNVPGYRFFICDIEASDIELLKELEEVLEKFVEEKKE